MNDKLSASWVLIVGTIALAFYYWKTKGASGPGKPPSGSVDSGASRQSIGSTAGGSILSRMEAIAQQFGLPITSTTGGQHVRGSLHYQGRAMDVGVRGISDDVLSQFIAAEQQAGFQVHEEWAGSTPYSTGHHLHVSAPFPGGGRNDW